MPKQSPKREPKFHINLILAGVGKSIRVLLKIFVSKLIFIGECIYYKKGNFDFPALNILSLWLNSLLE